MVIYYLFLYDRNIQKTTNIQLNNYAHAVTLNTQDYNITPEKR